MHITGRVRGGYYQGEGPASQEILDSVTLRDNDDIGIKIELKEIWYFCSLIAPYIRNEVNYRDGAGEMFLGLMTSPDLSLSD